MGFSRQEYWSGVPLPSPVVCDIVIEIPILFGPSHLMLPPSILFLHQKQSPSKIAGKLESHKLAFEAT